MRRSTPFTRTVSDICAAAFCDNGAQLDRGKVATALDLDMSQGQPLPTHEEITLFVCGGEDGVPPAALVQRYPRLNDVLVEGMT